MAVIGFVASILHLVLSLYVVVLFARLILEYIPMFNREWRPRGGMLIVCEIVYTLTDPPIRFFRRHIPPLRIGAIAIDLGFAITMLLCFIAMSILRVIAVMY
ncbi:YggT family protein [Microbacterium excoecariae]|uniref:YggT family protein n=1 Tax=Microbacterium TaxID=33882 RepID=UPI001326798C|nr:YggT family protein [Microbacterium sp. ZXX196]NHI16652.1 YggT family protein [Microbacterium excoecariae]